MTDAGAQSWEDANQRALSAALGRVYELVRGYLARAPGQPPAEAAAPAAPQAWALPVPPALDQICALFRLSAFERDLLLLCAGVELDARFPALCAQAQGDPQRAFATFSLALAALPEAHWDALTPAGALRRWRLIELGPGTLLTQSPLRIGERVLHFLAGVPHLDERLTSLVRPVAPTDDLAPSQRALAAQLARAWSRVSGERTPPVVQLCGDDRGGKRAVAAAGCAALGLRLHALPLGLAPTAPAELEGLLRLWEREAALSRSALLLDCDDLDEGEGARIATLRWLIDNAAGALILSTRERRRVDERPTLILDVGRPQPPEQRAIWLAALGPAAPQLSPALDQIVAQFSLGPQAIRSISAEALAAAGEPISTLNELDSALWAACRAHARPRLDDLAQRIVPAAGWDDLVLPEAQRQTLREITAHIRQRTTVYGEWGFAEKGERGLGISALFAGASGTGKTMAAEVLANRLRLDLYRIDLSAVVSKYIGETEKNLRRVFDAAETGGAILLFDEADALFGKRSDVKDSHDRYANIEVSYLLQRMEAYRGLAILTTNLKQAIDTAFLRRIRFVVQFPFPDAGQRAAIWARVFPAATPTEGLDAAKLARLNVVGGNIRNIALAAAMLAADAGAPVRMEHLLRAARAEYAKLEKPLTETEIEGWA